jgi:hypothetical protein
MAFCFIKIIMLPGFILVREPKNYRYFVKNSAGIFDLSVPTLYRTRLLYCALPVVKRIQFAPKEIFPHLQAPRFQCL